MKPNKVIFYQEGEEAGVFEFELDDFEKLLAKALDLRGKQEKREEREEI